MITSAPGKSRRSAATVSPIRSSSSRAATRTVSGSATGSGRWNRGQDPVLRGLLHAVLAGRGPAEQQDDGEPAGLEVVHRGEILLAECRGRSVDVLCALDTDGRHSGRADPGVEPGEKAGGHARLGSNGACDHDSV